MGRTWEAPAGSSLLLSTLLRPPADRRAAELTLVAGVCVAVVVERATGLAAQIKWPNDVMLNRRKVAGCLAELKDGAVVLGIGVNVNQRPASCRRRRRCRPARSVRSTGREYDRASILADLLLELEQRYDAWREDGLAALYEDLGARDFLRGRRVTVDGAAGTAQLITRDGRLAVETGSRRDRGRERRGPVRALTARRGVFAFASSRGSARARVGLTPRSVQSPEARRRSSSGRSAFE